MRKLYDDKLEGFTDQGELLTAGEMLAKEKKNVSRRFINGHYEVGISCVDDQPPPHRASTEDRLPFIKKYLQRRPNVAKKYCQIVDCVRKVQSGEIDDGPS